NSAPEPDPELQQLLAELVEGNIGEEQFQSLGRLLLGNPAAQEQYREYVELHALLQFEHRPQPAVFPEVSAAELPPLDSLPSVLGTDNEFPSAARSWLRGGWFSLGFVGLVIALGIGVAEGWLLYRGHAEAPEIAGGHLVNNVKPSSMPAAYLT